MKPGKDKTLQQLTEEKRAESVKQKIKSYQQHKLAIKEALCNLDKTPNHKIIFDEDSTVVKENGHTDSSKKRKKLFDESDGEENDSFNFDLKNQFDGDEGQQLFQLQAKYKGDKRFDLDERFKDDKNEVPEEHTEEPEEETLEKEKQHEIEILEQVLGTKLKPRKQKSNQSLPEKKMLRFDPTQSEHEKYEIVSEKKQKKKHKIKHVEEDKIQPDVSKDVFYKVPNDLKNTLQTEEGFSLRNLFNNEEPNEEDEEHIYEQPEVLKPDKVFGESNPFHYDSSEDEIGEEKEQSISNPTVTRDVLKFSEPFFFKDDDYRFQEGADFVKRIGSETNEAFAEQRKNLKNIAKAKVRQNNRKNNPFRKKLGGNKKRKAKRMGRAMKR